METDKKPSNNFKQVGVLTAANILAFSCMSLIALIGGLVGLQLAPNSAMATLPIAFFVVGTAAGIPPSLFAMKKLGRRKAFIFYCFIGIVSSLVMAFSLTDKNFILLCFGAFLLGSPVAAFQQVRFAAMELVTPEKAPSAVAIIMSGGIAAAFIGPEIGVVGRFITDVEYQGSLLIMAVGFFLSALILLFYNPAPMNLPESHMSVRKLHEILSHPSCLLAIASAAIGFVVMTFIMTATPIGMHHHFGHSIGDTKSVIQGHIIAMFLPAIIVPLLIKKLGIRSVMIMGLFCYSVTVAFGLIDSSLLSFWVQLILLGVGWNFLFFSGTTLLPLTHKPHEKFKVQAVNDSIAFGCQSLAALSAGWALSLTNWQAIISLCLVPMALMVFFLLWEKLRDIPEGKSYST